MSHSHPKIWWIICLNLCKLLLYSSIREDGKLIKWLLILISPELGEIASDSLGWASTADRKRFPPHFELIALNWSSEENGQKKETDTWLIKPWALKISICIMELRTNSSAEGLWHKQAQRHRSVCGSSHKPFRKEKKKQTPICCSRKENTPLFTSQSILQSQWSEHGVCGFSLPKSSSRERRASVGNVTRRNEI